MELREIPGTEGYLADVEGNIYNPSRERMNVYYSEQGFKLSYEMVEYGIILVG